MADIMIRGVSLPEGELKYVTLWVYGDGRVYVSKNASAASSKRLQDLAIPLPEGHGRLIDGTDLYTILDGGFDVDLDGLPETKDALLCMIQSAETIVPAEGGGEDG